MVELDLTYNRLLCFTDNVSDWASALEGVIGQNLTVILIVKFLMVM